MGHDANDVRQAVRERYAGHATRGSSCCGGATAPTQSCGCGSAATDRSLGYTAAELDALPEGADLGLGCGNPFALLQLEPGETVLDLGSGGGIDCFVASKRVGPTGRVIGVDMTPEMIDRARRSASSGGFDNVEFRLGEVEHLPVADASVDAVISNCVVNLVPDKAQVFREAFRVLAPGGRLSVSDIVTLGEVPAELAGSVEAYVACLSGAVLRDDYVRLIAEAGFTDVEVAVEHSYTLEDVVDEGLADEFARYAGTSREEMRAVAALFQSVRVSARKP